MAGDPSVEKVVLQFACSPDASVVVAVYVQPAYIQVSDAQ